MRVILLGDLKEDGYPALVGTTIRVARCPFFMYGERLALYSGTVWFLAFGEAEIPWVETPQSRVSIIYLQSWGFSLSLS
jgi:hypothetical protein